jgi:hypothetical protein
MSWSDVRAIGGNRDRPSREARAAVLRAKLYRWFALVAYNLAPPNSEELARRAVVEAKRQQGRSTEIRRAKDAVERCVDYVRKISPNYNSAFDAYYDPTGYHWTKFMVDYGGAEFHWQKCMTSMGRPLD